MLPLTCFFVSGGILVRQLLYFLVLFGVAQNAQAQYFARNCVQLPSIGWMAMDSSFARVNPYTWGVNDMVQIGTGYARDLLDLKLWWVSETSVGFGQVNLPGAPASRVAITVQGSTGLRYNFHTERWRPFTGFMLEIFQIFNQQPDPYGFQTATPTWAALRPFAGIEWIFTDDMSVELQAGYILLINFEDPVRQSIMARVAYKLYF